MITTWCNRNSSFSDEAESKQCFSKAGLLFLFNPKQSYLELLWCTLLTFLHGVAASFIIIIIVSNQLGGSEIVAWIIFGLSGISLFTGFCPEIAVFADNEQEFKWGSNHYQRPIYNILLAPLLFIPFNPCGIIIAVYFLQVIGFLPHPLVLIMWLFEQANIHWFGQSPRASDGRIILWFILNLGTVIGLIYATYLENYKIWLALTVGSSFILGQNLLGPLFLIKPFNKPNERLISQ
jgi:hypothetical protein